MEYWSIGVLECWRNGVLEYWGVGMLKIPLKRKELIEVDSIEDLALKEAFQKRIGEVDIIEVS